MKMQKFPSAEAAPEALRKHARKVEALAGLLVGMLNASEESHNVVLDALINVYVNAGESYGRSLECANTMLQIGGQIVLKDAMEKQAAGLDPFAPTTRH